MNLSTTPVTILPKYLSPTQNDIDMEYDKANFYRRQHRHSKQKQTHRQPNSVYGSVTDLTELYKVCSRFCLGAI
jgi:hypothetical protein